MLKQIIITGTLQDFTYELKGASNFPVAKVKVSTGEKFYEVDATGVTAQVANATHASAIGTPVKVVANLAFRQNSNTGDIYSNLELVSISPDFSGRQGGVGALVGVIGDLDERPTSKGGSFKVPQLLVVAADRDGLLNGPKVEIRFKRDQETELLKVWEEQKGSLVEVEVDLDAYISDKGRSYPRFTVSKASVFPLPESLGELFAAPANTPFDAGLEGDLDLSSAV